MVQWQSDQGLAETYESLNHWELVASSVKSRMIYHGHRDLSRSYVLTRYGIVVGTGLHAMKPSIAR